MVVFFSINQPNFNLPLTQSSQNLSLFDRVKTTTCLIFKSNVFRFLALEATASFSITVLVMSSVVPIILLAGAVSGIALCCLAIHFFRNRKKIFYELTLFGVFLTKTTNPNRYPWWHQITKQLYLGAIPLKNEDHDKKIKALGVKNIVSIVEDFEFDTKTIFSTPCTTKDWHSNRLNHFILSSPDFNTVTLETLKKGVEFLKRSTLAGDVAYVHCKAGKSRSTSLVMGYLLNTAQAKSVREAFSMVKTQRPFVSLSKKQRVVLEQYFKKHCSEKNHSSHV